MSQKLLYNLTKNKRKKKKNDRSIFLFAKRSTWSHRLRTTETYLINRGHFYAPYSWNRQKIRVVRINYSRNPTPANLQKQIYVGSFNPFAVRQIDTQESSITYIIARRTTIGDGNTKWLV